MACDCWGWDWHSENPHARTLTSYPPPSPPLGTPEPCLPVCVCVRAQMRIKMVTADTNLTTDIIVEGDKEEIERMRKVSAEAALARNGMDEGVIMRGSLAHCLTGREWHGRD